MIAWTNQDNLRGPGPRGPTLTKNMVTTRSTKKLTRAEIVRGARLRQGVNIK